MRLRNCIFVLLPVVFPLVLVSILLLLTAEVDAQHEVDRPRRYAILLGIRDYDSPKLDNLPSAERDITELAKELKAANYDELIVLLGSGEGNTIRATGENCRREFEKLLAKRLTKRDTLLIAMAGHGQQTKANPQAQDEEPFFLPKDAVLTDPKTMIAINDWLDLLDQQGAGTNLLLIDACRNDPDPTRGRSGGVDGGNRLRLPKDPSFDPKVSNSAGTVVFFACSKGQKAYESVKANGGIENAPGGHGVFFHFVLKGIRGEARDPRTQKVRWDGLVNYVKTGVQEEFDTLVTLRDGESRQVPHSTGTLVGSADLIAPPSLPKGLPKTLTIQLSATQSMEFVLIDPLAQPDRGEFLMGSSEANIALIKKKGWSVEDDETEHKVKLTKPYYLGRYEVTRAQFRAFQDATGTKTQAEKGEAGRNYGWNADKKTFENDKQYTWKNPGYLQQDDHPVVMVSWNDCRVFNRWLADRAKSQGLTQNLLGRKYQVGLPSEAQWEYAARSPKQTLFAHGDDEEDLALYGNVADKTLRLFLGTNPEVWTGIKNDDQMLYTSPVGRYRANRFGIQDLTGNVWEWCEDYYGKYDNVIKEDNPIQLVKQSNDSRVLRGGSWNGDPEYCRVAYRLRYSPGNRYYSSGFRVCLRLD